MGNTNIKLDLTLEQVNVVMQALSKLPFEVVADLITNVRMQAVAQVEAAKQAEVPPAE
jgi:hypothetical protein